MSEFSFSNGETSAINRLPEGFLQVNPVSLAHAAHKQRSMAELVENIKYLAQCHHGASNIANAGVRDFEEPDRKRHITRGAALMTSLLREASPRFTEEPESFMATTQEPPAWRTAMQEARDELVWSRARFVLAGERGEYDAAVDGVLAKADVGAVFETAVQGLTGAGLEEATRLEEAKYGAALIALGIGITQS